MKSKLTIIEHPSQLNALTTFPFSRKRGRGKIQFSDNFQHPEREQLEKAINKNYYACGCSSSAKFLIVGLIIGLVSVGVDSAFLEAHWIKRPVATLLILTFGGAILGKLIGLARANNKLKRTVHTVQAFWRPIVESTMKVQPDCG